MSKRLDAIVIGAGPYGLAAGAALRSAGVDPHVFGEPMSFWMEHMPKGMLLRSPWGASHIGDPGGPLSLDEFERVHGAQVEVILRAPALRWVGRATRDGPLGRVFFHRTDVGPAVVSQIVARPTLVRRLPLRTQRHLTRRSLAAGAALWLRPRMTNIALTVGRRVTEVARSNGHLRLRLDDGSGRDIDHVILATGYHVDIGRYAFLPRSLVSRVVCVDGHPVLDDGFQSSVPGLHFRGAPAVQSFGPPVRFVAGPVFAARTLARSIVQRHVMPTFSGDRRALYRAPEGRPR